MIDWFRGATVLLVVAVVWAALSALANPPRVAFVNPPGHVPENELFTLYVRVPRHPDNRLLIVAAVDEVTLVTETRRPLAGSDATPMQPVTWRLPAGRYRIIAAVFNARELVGQDTHPLVVGHVDSGP